MRLLKSWKFYTAIACVIFVGTYFQAIDHTFMSGKSNGTLRFLNCPVIWWGRIGKLLQFLAGLLALLDVVEPDDLRTLGRKAKAIRTGLVKNFSDAVAVESILAKEAALRQLITETKSIESVPEMPSITYTYLRQEGIESIPPGSPYSMEDYRALHSRFSRERHLNHDCTREDHQDVCAQQRHFLDRLIRDLFLDRLERSDAELLRRKGKEDTSGVVALYVILLGSMLMFALIGHAPKYAVISVLIACVFAPALFWRAGVMHRALYWMLERAAGLVASLLDKPKPDHGLRWAGIFLFLVGFWLDFFSS
ncbi:hypothetical protein [Actinoallomurus iriomotensis]|uniref:Uncharacterized protein n=1 Tax=Actinoallomurus iriomotensis TaxID=478107 RepID=A0A9W6W147_9ACTN|nr:hypothetical protein [Actinoallomurus iriomotensis]GLY85596.1 hypothetical protein Airi02_035250 [Actinoallomurus iriomotensis]